MSAMLFACLTRVRMAVSAASRPSCSSRVEKAIAFVVFAALLSVCEPARAQFTQQGSKLVGTRAVGQLRFSGVNDGPRQGSSVALSGDGNIAVVGGRYGDHGGVLAWVFSRSGRVWNQQARLIGTGAVGGFWQTFSVALSADGNTAIAGGPGDNDHTGAAWVFTRSGGVWTQQGAKLVGTGAVGDAQQGRSVALSGDGNTAIVGGPTDDGDKPGTVGSTGAVWIFTRSGGVWTQQGTKLVGTGAVGGAGQGWSIALSRDGNTAVAGGPYDNHHIGAAWVFTRSDGVWTQQGTKLVATGVVGVSEQGKSVALSANGNTAVLGAPSTDFSTATLTATGAARAFTRSGGVWTQQGSKLVGTGAVGAYLGTSPTLSFGGITGAGGAQQGSSVALSGDGSTAVVGGPLDNDFTGAAWVFIR